MLSRALLIFAAVSLGACNSAESAPLDLAGIGRLISSYAHSAGKAEEGSAGSDVIRSKELSRKVVDYRGNEPAGTVVVRTNERRLYFVVADKKAISYPVGVGKAGKQWQGRAEIDGAYVEPAWSPTPEMKRDNPKLPSVIPSGSPKNPMGAGALTLSGGKYAIHGTNRPDSIGTDASSGCIRMLNAHVIDLFGRVTVGTKVVVIRGS
jgi:lipoprotein-anchoring transpeptidase ErfK/SrfK